MLLLVGPGNTLTPEVGSVYQLYLNHIGWKSGRLSSPKKVGSLLENGGMDVELPETVDDVFFNYFYLLCGVIEIINLRSSCL